ncbi:DUF2187 domain-containing protein [Vagococcus xieshaowenii]|nr:DUF2187 domain-containing protein [Vagococcus xieshaowenii]QCA28322.1 DUF2187 domain-containing protein [Vagococcus xieshaowenii]
MMDITNIAIGKRYKCSSPLFNQEFTGIVEKVYDLSALVEVESCEEKDIEKSEDLNKRLVVPISSICE